MSGHAALDSDHAECVANGLHVPPIAYKLLSLSDLPGLILQVAGTPTDGVLVSVSVSAVVYTRIGSYQCVPVSSVL